MVRRAAKDANRGPSDPILVFRTLTEHEVDYVVIGGYAMIAHGSTRTTQDVDFVAANDPLNLQRLERALAELKAGLWGVDAHLMGIDLDACTFAEGASFTLTTEAGGVDYFNAVPGGAPYEQLRERAVAAESRGVRLLVAGVDDLIRMKRAAGRPRDLQDIAFLTQLEAPDTDS